MPSQVGWPSLQHMLDLLTVILNPLQSFRICTGLEKEPNVFFSLEADQILLNFNVDSRDVQLQYYTCTLKEISPYFKEVGMMTIPEDMAACSPEKTTKTGPVSPDRRVAKKYRKAHIRKLKAREYRRLRAVVPTIAHRDNVTKVTVIEEAIKYIDELHQALVERIQPENDCPVDPASGGTVAQELFPQSKALYNSTNSPVLTERNRLPSPNWRTQQHDSSRNS